SRRGHFCAAACTFDQPELGRGPHPEIDSAEMKAVAIDPVAAGDRTAECFGDVGDLDHDGTEAFGLTIDEADRAVLKGQDRVALVGAVRRFDDLRPVRGEVFWIWALEFDAQHPFGVAGSNKVRPLLPGRPPRAHAVVAAGRAA